LNWIGKGLKLQYIDSCIAEKVLMDLMKKDIPTLCVHDSFIVQEQHKVILHDKMMESYKKELGFKPMIH